PFGQQQVGGVMVSFGFDKSAVELRQFRIHIFQFGCENLEFFATAALDQATADEVINGLMTLAVADGFHEARNPGARIGLPERNPAFFEEVEHELEMLKFFDRDSV